MDQNGDDWWWTIMAYEWPYQWWCVDEDNDDHDIVDDALIDVDVDDDDVNDDDDAMYGVLDVDIHLSLTTL